MLKSFVWTLRKMFCQTCLKLYTVKPKAQDPKLLEKKGILSQEIYLPTANCSHKQVKCIWKPRRKKNGKRPRKVADCCKLLKFLFLETLFPFFVPMDTKKASLTTCQKFHNKKLTILRSESEKKRKIAQFVEKLLLLKIFSLWTRKRQFWQPSWNWRRKIVLKFFLRTRRKKFFQPCLKSLYRKAECSRSEKTVGKKLFLSQEIYLPTANCSHKQVKCIWKPRRKKLQKAKKSRWLSQNVENFFSRNVVSFFCSTGHEESKFDNLPNIS